MKILYEMSYEELCENEHALVEYQHKLIDLKSNDLNKIIVSTEDFVTRKWQIVELEDSDNARFEHLD